MGIVANLRVAVATLSLAACILTTPDASGVLVANYPFTGTSATVRSQSTDLESNSVASPYDTSNFGSVSVSGISGGAFNAFFAASGTPVPAALPLTVLPTTQNYHDFTLTVNGLSTGQVLNLTRLEYEHVMSSTVSKGTLDVFTSLAAFAGGVGDFAGRSETDSFDFADPDRFFVIPLSSIGSLSGMSNGAVVDIRLYFSDLTNNSSPFQRLDNVQLFGEVVAIPEPAAMAFFSLVGVTCYFLRRSGNDASGCD